MNKVNHYYEYERPNYEVQLPSAKRIFLRAKREMHGLKMYFPP